MSAIFIDTETTGLVDPDVIELAHSLPIEAPTTNPPGLVSVYRFKPKKPISIGAMATHHIIPTDLENEPCWAGMWMPPEGVTYFVGHNVGYDRKALKPSVPIKEIDTLALARKKWPDLDSYKLTALMYHLFPHAEARDLVKNAHASAVDVINCMHLFCELGLGHLSTWEEVYMLSEEARVPTHFTFGKYGPKDGKPGALIDEIKRTDRGYINWCIANVDFVKTDPYWQKALRSR